MADPLPEVKLSAISIEGLEEIFVEQDTPRQDTNPAKDSTPQATGTPKDSPSQDDTLAWTVDEAAACLGVSSKTVLRRLQKGSLKGYKVPGQFGLEWRVTKDTPGQVKIPPPDKTSQDSIEIIQLRTKVELMAAELKEVKQQLQGAGYRNGYLEAQAENYQSQIKLLTDSQHRRGRWSRFWSWFTGK